MAARLAAELEEILDRIGAVTNDNKKSPNTGITQAFNDVLQDWFSADFNHRLRLIAFVGADVNLEIGPEMYAWLGGEIVRQERR